MLKYGKRKAALLPSFSTLRDSSATSRMKTSKKRGSTTLETLGRPHISNPIPSRHDNSVDEMASMLLEDTTTVLDTTKRVAVQHVAPPDDKVLPQLPELLFNGDDAWAQRTTPVVTAAGNVNEIQFVDEPEVAGNSSSHVFGHSADHSTPPIPRRSSKRNSKHPKNAISGVEPQGKDQDDSLTPQQPSTITTAQSAGRNAPNVYSDQATIINAKVAAMQAALKALKPDASAGLLQGPLVPTKKRRIKDNKVVVKMRTVINDRLNSRSLRKRHDPIRDDHLLDHSLNELNDDEDLSQCVSNMDIRLNEGGNFNNPKVFSLTGHGNVHRKPVADDGRSIRSRKSNNTDPFSERPGSSGIARTPTNFELSLKDDMSIDPKAEIIPDLPTSRPQSSRESLMRGKKLKGSPLSAAFDTESFDALFSSSPLAQSTPRIRLEPTLEEDGRRTLKNVPADSRSLFDPDTSSVMDIDSTPAKPQSGEPLGVHIKRKSSLLKESAIGFRYHSKRTKKHPSPSKAELEGMEKTLQERPPFGTSETFILPDAIEVQDDSPADAGSPFPALILAAKDPNPKIKAPAKPTEKRMGIGLFTKPGLSRSGSSLPDIPRRAKIPKSMIPKPTDMVNTKPRQDTRYSLRDEGFNDTAMDIDELQRNESVYEIGVKK